MTDDAFSALSRRQHRIVALLQSYEGERRTTLQICDDLRVARDDVGSVIWMLCKLLEYRKVSHDWQGNDAVWWIEPPRVIEEPEFDIRRVKALARTF